MGEIAIKCVEVVYMIMLNILSTVVIMHVFIVYQVTKLIEFELSYINTNHDDFIGFAK